MALAIMDVFMQLNGFELMAREEDAALTIRSLAAGDLSETELAIWIQENFLSILMVLRFSVLPVERRGIRSLGRSRRGIAVGQLSKEFPASGFGNQNTNGNAFPNCKSQ